MKIEIIHKKKQPCFANRKEKKTRLSQMCKSKSNRKL